MSLDFWVFLLIWNNNKKIGHFSPSMKVVPVVDAGGGWHQWGASVLGGGNGWQQIMGPVVGSGGWLGEKNQIFFCSK